MRKEGQVLFKFWLATQSTPSLATRVPISDDILIQMSPNLAIPHVQAAWDKWKPGEGGIVTTNTAIPVGGRVRSRVNIYILLSRMQPLGAQYQRSCPDIASPKSVLDLSVVLLA